MNNNLLVKLKDTAIPLLIAITLVVVVVSVFLVKSTVIGTTTAIMMRIPIVPPKRIRFLFVRLVELLRKRMSFFVICLIYIL
jgi:hypothetical protein